MNKLSKEQERKRDELVSKLRMKEDEINRLITCINAQIETANVAVNELNTIFSDVRKWRDEIVEHIDKLVDNRSQRWIFSERGEKYTSWKAHFEDIDPIDLEPVGKISEVTEAEVIVDLMEQRVTQSVSEV